MQELKERIRQDLNNYQHQVRERLENLIRFHKISRSEYEMLLIEARNTGQAIIEALNSRLDGSTDVTEEYVYALFARYQNRINKKLSDLENPNISDNKPSNNYQSAIFLVMALLIIIGLGITKAIIDFIRFAFQFIFK